MPDFKSPSMTAATEPSVRRSADEAAIMAAVMLTDEDFLHYSKLGEPLQGWVRLIYGNDGWDVVNDYTTNLEPLMAGATAEADSLEAEARLSARLFMSNLLAQGRPPAGAYGANANGPPDHDSGPLTETTDLHHAAG